MRGNDLTLSRLRFTGRAATLEASGQVAANQVDLVWSLAVSDLAAAEPQLAGQLQATGKICGATDDLDLTAELAGNVAAHGMSSGALAMNIEASGLPGHPSGRITAHGDLLDAPVELAVALRRQLTDWRSTLSARPGIASRQAGRCNCPRRR